LNEYLCKFGDWLTFYAEDVFQVLARTEPEANALKLESDLAALADAIIIIAESPGTFAELGAFALSGELRSKLLPVAPIEYKNEESFLNVGPIRWVDKDSFFRPTIWADFSVILTVAAEITERLTERIHQPTTTDVRKIVLRESSRHLLFLVVLITDILGPASASEIRLFLEQILGPDSGTQFVNLIALAKSLKLINSIEFEGEVLYFRTQSGGVVGEMRKLTPQTVAGLRAQVLSAMLAIPSAAAALEMTTKGSTSAT
jgi:hypothetical protein